MQNFRASRVPFSPEHPRALRFVNAVHVDSASRVPDSDSQSSISRLVKAVHERSPSKLPRSLLPSGRKFTEIIPDMSSRSPSIVKGPRQFFRFALPVLIKAIIFPGSGPESLLQSPTLIFVKAVQLRSDISVPINDLQYSKSMLIKAVQLASPSRLPMVFIAVPKELQLTFVSAGQLESESKVPVRDLQPKTSTLVSFVQTARGSKLPLMF